MIAHAEDRHRVCQLTNAMLTEAVVLVSREVLQVGDEHFTFFSERARHQRYLNTLGHVLGHDRSRSDRLVIGMRMDEKKAAVRHRHTVRLLARTWLLTLPSTRAR